MWVFFLFGVGVPNSVAPCESPNLLGKLVAPNGFEPKEKVDGMAFPVPGVLLSLVVKGAIGKEVEGVADANGLAPAKLNVKVVSGLDVEERALPKEKAGFFAGGESFSSSESSLFLF